MNTPNEKTRRKHAKRIGVLLRAAGITSLAQLNRLYDKASGLQDIKGIGPALADTLQWLRSLTDEEFEALTGIPAQEV